MGIALAFELMYDLFYPRPENTQNDTQVQIEPSRSKSGEKEDMRDSAWIRYHHRALTSSILSFRSIASQNRIRVLLLVSLLALNVQNVYGQGPRRSGFFLSRQQPAWQQGPSRPNLGSNNNEGAATGCERSTGTCNSDGSSNFADLSQLAYNPVNGKFTGTMKYNGCANHPTSGMHALTAACYQKTFPDPSTSQTSPSAAPLLGSVGISRYGVQIYGPFEAGFGSAPNSNAMGGGRPVPNPCGSRSGNGIGGSHGYCAGGIDVKTCEEGLLASCGPEETLTELFLDDCGGHANPYHYHADLSCSYGEWHSPSDQAFGESVVEGHAPLLGFGNDGFGIYGLYEAGSIAPTNLDACNGHFGVVPIDDEIEVDRSEADDTQQLVYHYHTTELPPFTIGCYGPLPESYMPVNEEKTDSQACKSLYEGCRDGQDVPLGTIVNDGLSVFPDNTPYKLWCPCFPQ